MEKEGLPPEIVRLIRNHIDSVGQLEILLLLHANAGTPLTAVFINEKLRSNLMSVEQRLSALANHGLVIIQEGPPPTYVFSPASHDLARAVDRLSEMYIHYRVRVIDTIYAPPDQMQSFSDAFRIKKEPETHG